MEPSHHITAVIPARAGSERVKHKNTHPFAGINGGHLELKLAQLARVAEIERIIVSTNDPAVLDFTRNFSVHHDRRAQTIERPQELGLSSTPMSAFIRYAATLQDDGVMLMTHVTHPFVNSAVISKIIEAWKGALRDGHDSLITVTKLHKFIWDENGPYNYDITEEKWLKSQDIKPLFEINHATYIILFSLMRKFGDRVGINQYLHETSAAASMDIDWQEQFDLLQDIAIARLSRDESLL